MGPTLNAYYEEAVVLFARREGRFWKAALRHAWMTGQYPYTELAERLQYLRNAAAFGPAGLVQYRLPKVERESP